MEVAIDTWPCNNVRIRGATSASDELRDRIISRHESEEQRRKHNFFLLLLLNRIILAYWESLWRVSMKYSELSLSEVIIYTVY
jgi:hypothetical protein